MRPLIARFSLVLLAWCALSDDGLDSVSWYVPCKIEVGVDGAVYDMPFGAEASNLKAEALALIHAIHATHENGVLGAGCGSARSDGGLCLLESVEAQLAAEATRCRAAAASGGEASRSASSSGCARVVVYNRVKRTASNALLRTLRSLANEPRFALLSAPWDPKRRYRKEEIVQHGGLHFECQSDCSGVDPPLCSLSL